MRWGRIDKSFQLESAAGVPKIRRGLLPKKNEWLLRNRRLPAIKDHDSKQDVA
jgi:hypothetical protein